MAGKKAPASPEVVEIDLRGKTGPQIAQMIHDGDLVKDYAENFVADRAVRKLNSALERLQS